MLRKRDINDNAIAILNMQVTKRLTSASGPVAARSGLLCHRYFGMKANIGVDAELDCVNVMAATAANVSHHNVASHVAIQCTKCKGMPRGCTDEAPGRGNRAEYGRTASHRAKMPKI